MSATAQCLIVDDESPARDELRFLLADLDDVTVVGEAATADEALMLARSVTYDVVLLDIHMPGLDGLELARRLASQCDSPPAIVFTTAHPDYAVEAFDVNAADYLVKPFDVERLQRALRRALGSAPDPEDPEEVGSGTAPVGRIPIHKGDRVVLVDEADIVYASAARGYSSLKLADERVLASFSLNELQERLSGDFVRTHRSHLVNLRRVRELVSDYRGSLELVVGDRQGSRVPVARRRAADLRRLLGM